MSQELTTEQSIEQLEIETPTDAAAPEEKVRRLMESSRTQAEWNANCDRVKAEFGDYPAFWFKEILQSGLAGRVAARFGRDDQIHIQTITLE